MPGEMRERVLRKGMTFDPYFVKYNIAFLKMNRVTWPFLEIDIRLQACDGPERGVPLSALMARAFLII